MFGLGINELIVIAVLALLLFGNQLPAVARWLGNSVGDFKKEADSITQDFRSPGGK